MGKDSKTVNDPINKKGVLFFLEGSHIPASRFRIKQFSPVLEREGISSRFLTTFPSKYLWMPDLLRDVPFVSQVWLVLSLVFVVFQRLAQIALYVRSYKIIVFQRDLLYRVNLPFLEWIIFKLALPGTRFVFDIDDAIYLGKDGEPCAARKKKLGFILRCCNLVIAGNDRIKSKLETSTPITVIPTVVDTERYFPKHSQGETLPIIGWSGVASNLSYLAQLRPVFEKLAIDHKFKVRIITEEGARSPFVQSNFLSEIVPWSDDTEIESLRSIDIGVMPLRDDEWSRSKCGFKLLQYMALEIPSVASAVGVNQEIVQNGENGFLASNEDEWISSFGKLLNDSETRKIIGSKARKTVEERYSLKRWSPDWVKSVLGRE